MKQLLFLLISIAIVGKVSAQDITFFNQENIVTGITADDFEGVGYDSIYNASALNRNLTWTIEAVDIADGWELAVCDKNLCYLPSTTSAEFTIFPDEVATMDVHAYPNNVEGFAIARVTLTEATNPDTEVSQLYYFNINPNSTNQVEALKVKLYPNPVQDFFTISEVERAERVIVRNLQGQQVVSFPFQNQGHYNIANLPAGQYLIQLERDGAQSSVMVTKQ